MSIGCIILAFSKKDAPWLELGMATAMSFAGFVVALIALRSKLLGLAIIGIVLNALLCFAGVVLMLMAEMLSGWHGS